MVRIKLATVIEVVFEHAFFQEKREFIAAIVIEDERPYLSWLDKQGHGSHKLSFLMHVNTVVMSGRKMR